MKKTIVEIYALSVCFVSVGCLVIVLSLAIWDIVGAMFPEFTVNAHEFERHQSNEDFLHFRLDILEIGRASGMKTDVPKGSELSEEQVSQARARNWNRLLKVERRGAVQGLARNIIILFIDIVLIWVHWGIARRARDAHSN